MADVGHTVVRFSLEAFLTPLTQNLIFYNLLFCKVKNIVEILIEQGAKMFGSVRYFGVLIKKLLIMLKQITGI